MSGKRIVVCALLLSTASARAEKTDVAALLAPSGKLVLHGSQLPQLRVFEWERNGTRYNAWPGDTVQPPYDAADLRLRVFSFPGGMIRELYYKDGAHTPPHVNHETIVMYGISGKRVQVVDTDVGVLGAGDASFHPVGVVHQSLTVVAGSQLEFAFPGKAGRVPKAAWLSASQAVASPGIANSTIKTFAFPGITLLETHVPGNTTLPPSVDGEDSLVYVLSGKMRVTIGQLNDEVGQGDALRFPAGVSHHLQALQDSVIVQVSPPKPKN
jgi:quercetin dioxygenase-like cupin family protein